MKNFVLLFFLLISFPALCQKVRVDRKLFSVENFYPGGVILGIDPITVYVNEVYFDKGKNQYIVRGRIPAFIISEDTVSQLSIDLLRGKATVRSYSSTQKGLFEVRVKRDDTLVFYDSTSRYAAVLFKRPNTSTNKRKY